MALNVKGDVFDPYYRYQMPQLCLRIEGRGNGVRTVVDNLHLISKAINRLPTCVLKYFGHRLGAQTSVDAKQNRYIINGQPTRSDLHDLLFKFIREYVICQTCQNPETLLGLGPALLLKPPCCALLVALRTI